MSYWFSLHFRYNQKKYLYGLSEQLVTFGQENGLLYKMNGTYEPTQRQKKEKSTLQLKKEKIIMKIDYIILPRKACCYQYLWQFDNIFEKLACRNFVILRQGKNEQTAQDNLLKTELISFLNKISNLSQSKSQEYKIEMFSEHNNFMRKQKKVHTINKDYEDEKQDGEIYESDINQMILEMFRRDCLQYVQKSIFGNLNPQHLTKLITDLQNQITNNSILDKNLQLTPQQLKLIKLQLSQQISRISSSENIIYPTQSQELQLVFLPSTSMIMLLHKHHIALVNPSNLASWKMHYLNLPVQRVRQIILTRFSMAFVEFILQWCLIEKQKKTHSFLQIITLDWIYTKIKQTLYEQFFWDDEIIRSKIAFRVIPSSNNNIFLSKNRLNRPKQQFYTLGYLKLCYEKNSISMQSWIIRFGDKEVLLLNQLVLWKQEWLKRFQYVIFDKVKQETKQDLYGRCKNNKQISLKFVYNRSSQSKYRQKHLHFIHEQNPIIRIRSIIKMQQNFIPYIEKYPYKKVKLSPGERVSSLDNNVVVVEGLIGVFNEVDGEVKDSEEKVLRQTQMRLYYPVELTTNGGTWSSVHLQKIRKVKELIALKESVVLIEKFEDQHGL